MAKGYINSDLGEVAINPEVIAYYAGSQAIECFGIVGMAAMSVKDGVMKILKKDSLAKGVNVELNNNKISIDFHVIVVYGLNIVSVAENLVENVKYKVETFTGLEVEKINVIVEGVRNID